MSQSFYIAVLIVFSTGCGVQNDSEFKSTRGQVCTPEATASTADKCSQGSNIVKSSVEKTPTSDDNSANATLASSQADTASTDDPGTKTEATSEPTENAESDQENLQSEDAEAPEVALVTWESATRKIWKPCADACHSENGELSSRQPYLNQYSEAKKYAKTKRFGHRGIFIGSKDRRQILEWIENDYPEN